MQTPHCSTGNLDCVGDGEKPMMLIRLRCQTLWSGVMSMSSVNSDGIIGGWEGGTGAEPGVPPLSGLDLRVSDSEAQGARK